MNAFRLECEMAVLLHGVGLPFTLQHRADFLSVLSVLIVL